MKKCSQNRQVVLVGWHQQPCVAFLALLNACVVNANRIGPFSANFHIRLDYGRSSIDMTNNRRSWLSLMCTEASYVKYPRTDEVVTMFCFKI
ncbi:hypothetical protein TNIN_287971 [Trichonephila inaurata madagascariensis]|uniref:Uncharacterized protein n=1 Tax=Trichonephila inaurata madagascariensis TaxID=2747483 RepID=A0A8X6Y8N5_9ARAC|nr:hypothetical protein TNIN_287971 [Trichonephila inaurata madagascariensis]